MHLIVEFDGGSRGNPGPAGFGVVVRDARDESMPLVTAGRFVGRATNNVAEYSGLVFALQNAVDLRATRTTVRGDSELVIKQMKGQYRVKNEKLKPLFEQASSLAKKLGKVSYVHKLRDENKLADRLANLAMDRKGDVDDID
ncbi:MAG: reverse transcriptase-like protein [Planctomycetota bacterium]